MQQEHAACMLLYLKRTLHRGSWKVNKKNAKIICKDLHKLFCIAMETRIVVPGVKPIPWIVCIYVYHVLHP